MFGYLNVYISNKGRLDIGESGLMQTEEEAVKEAAAYVNHDYIYQYTAYLTKEGAIRKKLARKIQKEWIDKYYNAPPTGSNKPWDGGGEADSYKAWEHITEMTNDTGEDDNG